MRKFFLPFFFLFQFIYAFSQAPNISYTSPQNYVAGTAISPLTPVNTGGAVPVGGYGQITNLANFTKPWGCVTDAAGNVYVADPSHYVIKKITPSGVTSVYAGNGVQGTADGTLTTASFGAPRNLAIDNAGNIYVTENSLPYTSVRKISPLGIVSTLAKEGSPSTDGSGPLVNFSPTCIAIDVAGNIYVGEHYDIRKIDQTGGISTFAGIGGNGGNAIGYVDATGTTARFNGIDGLVIDAAGNMYAADYFNNHIRKITPSAAVSTIAGDAMPFGTTPKIADGPALSVDLPEPQGLAIDNLGNIYFSENGVSSLRVLTPAGMIVTVPTAGAALGSVYGITYCSQNNSLYVSDYDNSVIRNISLSGYSVNPALPVGLILDSSTGQISGTPTSASPSTTYTITARNLSGIGSASLTITVITTAPTISAITPTTAATGSTITITGTNFIGATAVTFGGVNAATFSVVSATTATAVVGAGASGSVSLTTPAGTATLPGFKYVPAPTITAGGETTFIIGGSVVLSASTGTGYTYQWMKDGVNISGATTSTYTATQSGSYTASVTVSGIKQISNAIAVTTVFALPATNFNLTVTSASCRGSSTGSVSITAGRVLNYVVTITGGSVNASYQFVTTTTINNLAAGTYNVCFKVIGESNYQQCFTIVIDEPKDLAVYVALNKTGNSITLTMNGGSVYNIKLNGVTTTTTNSSINLNLSNGINNIEISTDKACQGTITKQITLSDTPAPYPNPFSNTLNINLGDKIQPFVEIYNQNGLKVYSKHFADQSGIVQVDLSALSTDVYIVRISSKTADNVFKIIKNK
ncbi:hypothetical protein BEL04_12410 [Mucilaginibacter sp. PPCGB 2223]|uniref:T9SS type A sorting domain-containing protein n=1 Tax=Mucilaginibacter sp. PPCGB 2223 TaxID=1886027 RepID=UPI000824B768|nr:T9SS type A sorting domain-containing protein [Mucilaginibacter sp. PPCGB 2223]OCX52273.1 hypothetical protein BEL04_12410 [Mucilaginibacter sp. PPCGB 2223]